MYPIIQLTESIYIPTYFLVISIGYAIGVYWAARRADQLELSRNRCLDICLILMVGGFLGSRIFHVLYELPDHYKENPLDVFKVWQGGFVFYGGVLGAVLPIWLYLRLKGDHIIYWLNLFAPVISLSYAIGRFATLLSGSGFGRPTDLPWGITYPMGTEAPSAVALHPTPIYAILWELGALALLLSIEKSGRPLFKKAGSLFFLLMICHGLGRGWIEQFRDDFRGELIVGLTVSTWISLAIVVIGIIGLVLNRRRG